MNKTIRQYQIDYVEIDEMDIVEQVGVLGKPVIFRLSINTEADLGKLKSNLNYLDEFVKMVVIKSGNESLFDQIDAHTRYYNGNLRLLKGYGISESGDPGTFPGLELEASEEEYPGFKDYGHIMDVLELIEAD